MDQLPWVRGFFFHHHQYGRWIQFLQGCPAKTDHQYQPLTKKGSDAVGGNFNDDPLWLILFTDEYIRETGDWSILDEMVPFDNDVMG